MGERRVLVKAFAGRYQGAGRRGRSEVLSEFVEVSGYNRSYASWLLRWHGRRVRVGERVVVVGDAVGKARRRRARVYGPEVVAVVRKLWGLLDYASGKRLAPALPALVEALERHGELVVGPEVRGKLLSISAATLDRVLAVERRKLALKGRARTKPGTLLRHQVPVRTFAEWDEEGPGFAELDLVAHDGGVARGEYIQTLDLTDVATGWTELAAVPTRAQVWVFEALKEVRARLPFPLLGIDSDNGGEFINNNLVAYCAKEQITFTRSRPYRKNDNCFVEQKNWSVVRRFVGYGRLEGAAALRTVRELYAVLRLFLNFFVPSMKLIAKQRQGSRVRKHYDTARTPYERALASATIDRAIKRALHAQYRRLNPAEMMRRIRALQHRLLQLEARLPLARPVNRTLATPPPPSTRRMPAAPAARMASPHSPGVDF